MHLFDIDVPGEITFTESDVLSPGKSLVTFQSGDYPTMVIMHCPMSFSLDCASCVKEIDHMCLFAKALFNHDHYTELTIGRVLILQLTGAMFVFHTFKAVVFLIIFMCILFTILTTIQEKHINSPFRLVIQTLSTPIV